MREEAQQVCDWSQSQAITLGTGGFSLSGLILSPILTAVLSGTDLQIWQISLFLVGAALAANQRRSLAWGSQAPPASLRNGGGREG
jgi:hypothetical protein